MAGWEIVRRAEEPDRYAACAAAIPPGDAELAPWSGPFGRRIYPTHFPPDSLLDASIALCHRRRPIALVEAVLDPRDRLTRHGAPLQVALAPDTGELAETAIGRVLDCLVGEVAGLPLRPAFLEVEDFDVSGVMTPLGLAAMKRGGQPLLVPWPILDLRQPEAALWRAVRPSYRTNVAWGKRHLDLLHFSPAMPDTAVFEAAVAFLAAHETVLTPANAAFYRNLILAGQGEATLIRHEGRLVGCSIIAEEAGTGFYAVAAYDSGSGARTMPVAHWPLWQAICRCRARGCHRFELYRVFFRGQERPGYRFGTAHFKLGFTDTIRQRIVWRIPFEREGGA